jgi:hypothetical protein
MKQLRVTELDFDQIKQNIKNYYKNHPNQTYADWDFEGSGLDLMLDVLAYNTHYNAITAHSAVNETFLDTAQLRSNVVSRAKLLSYIPHSRLAPKAVVSLVFPSTVSTNESYTLDIGKKFRTVIDGISFYFVTRNTYSAQLENGVFTFPEVEIYEGLIKQSQHLIDSSLDREQKIVVSDRTIDTSNMTVRVYDSVGSTNFRTFTRWESFTDIDGESLIFFLTENYDGDYEIRFGNNVFGKKPDPQNLIVIEYLSTKGAAANGATSFVYADGAPAPISLSLVSKAFNGSDVEDINSIRFNAPLSFTTQNRAVTAQDYRNIINANFPFVDSMSVWGGEDAKPTPQYGRVFIAIKPPGADTLTDQQKEDIQDILVRKNVLTVETIIVDPIYTYLYFDVLFKYNPNATTLTNGELRTNVRDTIQTYNDDSLSKFDGVFRHSEFLNLIDETDNAILNTTARIKAYKNVQLTYGNLTPQDFSFDFKLDGKITQTESFISSESWTYNGTTLNLADEYIPNISTYRNIYAFTTNAKGEIVKQFTSLGKIYIETGEVELSPFPLNQNETIKLFVKPSSNDVAGKRNTLLRIDMGLTKLTAEQDAIAVSGGAGAIKYNTFDREES